MARGNIYISSCRAKYSVRIVMETRWTRGYNINTRVGTWKKYSFESSSLLNFFFRMLWRVASRVWLNKCCTSDRLRKVVLFKQWLELSIERRYDVMACWSIHGNTLVSCTGRPKFLTRCCINCLFSFLFHFMTIISLFRYYQLLVFLFV